MLNAQKLALLALLPFALVACVAGSEASHHAADGGTVSVLMLGFWHGIIAPITLIGEVINLLAPHLLPWTIRFYETQQTGAIYAVGFFVGLLTGPSILWSGTSRRRILAP